MNKFGWFMCGGFAFGIALVAWATFPYSGVETQLNLLLIVLIGSLGIGLMILTQKDRPGEYSNMNFFFGAKTQKNSKKVRRSDSHLKTSDDTLRNH